MAELCKKCSSIQVMRSFPGIMIVGCAPVPEAIELKTVHFAQPVFIEQLFNSDDRWVVSVLFNYKKFFAGGFSSPDHLFAVFSGYCHRFFAEYMMTGIQAVDGM